MIRTKILIGTVVGLNLVVGVLSTASADPASDAQAQESWRDMMARNPSPADGCFHASYPSTRWEAVECVAAPSRPFLPRSSALAVSDTVGNGNDFAAESSSLISQTVGTFPTVTGVKTEKDGTKNEYSLQLNSNFMSTAACGGISGCMSWEQFVYSSGEEQAFMQYWLINYGSKCPAGGWNAVYGSCYKNSAAVSVPKIVIADLDKFKMSGTAVSGGNDTLVFTNGTEAYTTSGKDSVVDLATDWSASEFNIIGDGGGSKAVFNVGSSITVKVALTNGSTKAPTCGADDGTTGETNNLKLGSCSATGGSTPFIEFTESN